LTDKQFWFERLESFGDRIAIFDENGEAVTYTALAARADVAAEAFRDARLVAIMAERNIATVIAYLACLRRGIPVIMAEAGTKSDRLLASFSPDLIVHDGITTFSGSNGSHGHRDLRLLLSTSGSTGSAKLVRLSAQNIDSNARSICEYLCISQDDVAITSLPLYYSFGISLLNSHLAAGAAIVVVDHAVTSPEFLEAVERHAVSSISGVPTTFDLLVKTGAIERLPASVRTFTQAGGRLAPKDVSDLVARLARRGGTLWVMYGQTEASPRMAYLPPELVVDHPDCIGRAIPGGTLTIEDNGEAIEQGAVGELVYRGPNVMMGYATSRADLARDAEVDALRTGDLAREVVPGIFRIEGRIARFIKPLGLRVGLDELEALAGANVRVAGNDARGAVVVATSQAALDTARAAHASLGLPPSALSYHCLNDIPQLGSGKIDYQAILSVTEKLANPHTPHDSSAAIEDCFIRAARGQPISDDVTYVQIGGDSLSFVEASIAIEAALGMPCDDWATTPLGSLKSAAAAHTQSGVVPARMSGISPDVLVRALAIVLVVLNHAVGMVEGGADVMMVLAGLGWARFQRARIIEFGVWRSLTTTLARLLMIFYTVVLLYGLAKRHLYVSHLLLVSTFFGDWGGSLNIYWFIESLVWCTVIASVGYAAIGTERFRRDPLAFSIALFVVAIGVRFAGAMIWDAPAHRMRSPDQMLVYFAAGAILCEAQLRSKLLTALVIVGLSSRAWGVFSSHSIIMAICCALLVFKWRLPVPQAGQWMIRLVARNSFYIYIMQIVPMYVVDQMLNTPHGKFWPLHLLISFAVGLGVGMLLDRYDASIRRYFSNAVGATRRAFARA
jgi:acyl-CoA synthetase (AMP-forming)/AMP-acid ligase II